MNLDPLRIVFIYFSFCVVSFVSNVKNNWNSDSDIDSYPETITLRDAIMDVIIRFFGRMIICMTISITSSMAYILIFKISYSEVNGLNILYSLLTISVVIYLFINGGVSRKWQKQFMWLSIVSFILFVFNYYFIRECGSIGLLILPFWALIATPLFVMRLKRK